MKKAKTKTEKTSNKKELLTSREYFAVSALQGLLANELFLNRTILDTNKSEISLQVVMAKAAISYADALIEELEKVKN